MTLASVGLGLVLLLVTIGGIAFNGYILFFTCTKSSRQNRSASQILLLHLGFLNLLLAVLFLTAFTPNFFESSLLGNISCNYVGPFWESLHIVAVWTVMSLNADKYITIASPLHYARFVSPSKAVAILAISWVLAVCIAILPSIIEGLSFNERDSSGCAVDLGQASFVMGNVYASFATFLGYVLPILIVAVANGRILVIASHHRHRIVSALWNVTLSAQATVTQQKSHFYLTSYRGKTALTTILHHVGTLLIMYLPMVGCRIYESVTRLKVNYSLETCAFVLLVVSPTVNGFVYGVKSKVLRKLMVHLLRKQLYKSEVSCEIQARVPSVTASRRPSVTPSITLPLQKQLTRRMSEIFTTPCTTPSNASVNSGTDPRHRLERQSSDLSWSKIRGSTTSIPRDSSTPLLYRFSGVSPIQKFFPKPKPNPFSLDLRVPSDDSSNSQASSTGKCDLNSSHRQDSLEMVNGAAHNGSHRQSLRRALFARNKQKSLDLERVQHENKQLLIHYPPRSVSHNQMQDPPLSPSLVRPLILADSELLSPAKKAKKVSWSCDSFNNTEKLIQNSPSDAQTALEHSLINSKVIRQIYLDKHNDLHATSVVSNHIDKEMDKHTKDNLPQNAPTNLKDSVSVDDRCNKINVFSNPLGNGLQEAAFPSSGINNKSQTIIPS